jgi:hypothetical protein
MPRFTGLAIFLLLIVAAFASLVAWHEKQQLDANATELHKLSILTAENDALREALTTSQNDAADAKDEQRRTGIEQTVSQIRELPFKHPVEFEMLDRSKIKDVVADKLGAQYSHQEMANVSTALTAFGLLPPNYPLEDEYIALLGEQIGAFYDQHQHKLFMFQGSSLENSQNRVILAHELTHALQDQNFGLLKLPLEIKTNDDLAETISAVVEGDATLVMEIYMQRDISMKTFTDMVTYSVTQRMEEIRKAPKFLREMMVFPYIKGQQFCQAVYLRGGFAALTKVYADPPVSTAQIMHPEKYFPETRENPIQIDFPSLDFNGQQPLANNVMGEMGCSILFAQWMDSGTAGDTAAGWRGDRYLVFDHGDTLVWKTAWSTPDATDAARAAMQTMCEARFKMNFTPDGLDSAGKAPGRVVRIVPAGTNQIVFILTTNEESAGVLEKQFASHG